MDDSPDFVITRFALHVPRLQPRDYAVRTFRSLVGFLQDNGLTVRRLLSEGEGMPDDFQLKKSDLTDDGFLVMQKGYDKWLRKIINRRKDPGDITILDDALSAIRDLT